MNGTIVILALAGLSAFFAGVVLASSGSRELGIALMGFGLLCQVLCLRQLRLAKGKGMRDAG